ncbi:MAG: hypothetical protein C4520_14845 [Candidatus Abyssobacteria bacterium SURF_5]|jgi:atypical dual specificity phosphatase|uniref:Uncharacterized protein n=1 Tax=Abyssobacteria bacterium (strain SURF_5) TaxID=2093360 RepID=A0A3A4NHM5_ABYX5|nr:MAG: hypothetical protein C4520_14845 [Candidatus Abyssubacteria bacterium SURF_5]
MEYRRTLLNFSFVVPGLLAGMARPGTTGSLEQDLIFLQMQGIKALLSLSEAEVDEQTVLQRGFDFLHIPVADFTAPTLKQVEQAMEFVERKIDLEGKPVVIFCGAGCGRTGTFLACYFVKKGKLPEEAIHHVRSIRPCSIETGSQRELIYKYAEHLRVSGRDGKVES